MPDAIFAHPRLAAIYDTFDGDRDDLAVYLSIAGELGTDRVLDIGCGTGCLAVLLAESGCTVAGADPAGASLEVAKSKDPAGRITWIQDDAAAGYWRTARWSLRTPPSGSAIAANWNPAWPAMAIECSMSERPLIAQAASSCSSPCARPELTGQP